MGETAHLDRKNPKGEVWTRIFQIQIKKKVHRSNEKTYLDMEGVHKTHPIGIF